MFRNYIMLGLCFFYFNKTMSQSTNSQKCKIIKGFFIIIRDTIPDTDYDVILGHDSFKPFFFQNMPSVYELTKLDSLLLNSEEVFLLSNSVNGYVQKSTIEKETIYNIIKERQGIEIESEYDPFDYNKIPNILIESRLKFISVFQGQIEVWGELSSPYILERSIKSYLYLLNINNHLDYLYSIVLNGKTSCGYTINCND